MAKPGIEVRIFGDKKIAKAMEKIAKASPVAMGAGLYAFGNDVMKDSKRMTPVDEGALVGSGYVTLPERDGSVELGYGGPAKDYAVIQHEDTTLDHPDGGEAKFLEKAMNKNVGKAARRIARVSGRALREARGARRNANMPTDPDQGRP